MTAPDDQFHRLIELMATLRGPDGCPWDHKQTLGTLRSYLVEETYEVLEVMDGADAEAHRLELGDLLFQIIFQARIREEQGAFGAQDVARAIADKLERRHPHVFGDRADLDAAEIARQWQQIKQEETGRESALDGLPKGLPALLRSLRLGQKAAGVGFDWAELSGVLDKIDEERLEVAEALAAADAKQIEHELGDYLFSVVNLCRHLKVDPEAALNGASTRFETRFRTLESQLQTAGQTFSDHDEAALEARWQAVKKTLSSNP